MRRNRNKKKHVLTFLAGTVVTTSTNGVSAQIIIPSDSTQFDVPREEISCYGRNGDYDPLGQSAVNLSFRGQSWVVCCRERPKDFIAKVLVGSAYVVLVITGVSVIGYIWSAGSDLPPSDLSSSNLSSIALPSSNLSSNDSILGYAEKSLEECLKLLANGTQQCTPWDQHDKINEFNCQLTTTDNISSWIPSSWQSGGKIESHDNLLLFKEGLAHSIISLFDGAKNVILSSKEGFEALLKGIQKEGGHLAKFANCALGSA